MIQLLQQRYNDYNRDTTITTKIQRLQRLQQRYSIYNKDALSRQKLVA